jgi:hypothetical protein
MSSPNSCCSECAGRVEFAFGNHRRRIADRRRSTSLTIMPIVAFCVAFLAAPVSASAQVEAIPTFTVTSNDVVQSSIMVFHMGGTNDARVSIKFAFTEAGASRLWEFYHANPVGQEVRYQIGKFERAFKLDDRKHFGREGFWGLPFAEAKNLEAGLKGQR